MSGIERYILADATGKSAWMEVDDDGDYVLYSDHLDELATWKYCALTAAKDANELHAEVARLSAQAVGEPVSPMAKMAAALREKAAMECTEYSQRVQSGEWGPMPEAETEADSDSQHVATVEGDDSQRVLHWNKDVRGFDYEPGTKLYTAPPAQSEDLDAVRALLQRRIEQWRSHLPADPGAPGTREIEAKGEHDYNNDVALYRQGIAVMEEVLFKIEGQAVGK